MQRTEKISKLKKLYYAYKDGYFVDSIKEFLELDWVKRFKNTGSFKKHPLEKDELKQLNKKRRISAKKEIAQGLQEWNDRYNDNMYTCQNCEWFENNKCEMHKATTYPDNRTCKDFIE